jgi:hypothetical protein
LVSELVVLTRFQLHNSTVYTAGEISMKFARLLLLVMFSFMSIGLNVFMVRADQTGQGYGYGCQAPVSLPDGSVGCGDQSSETPNPPKEPERVSCDDAYQDCLKDADREENWASRSVETAQCVLEATACYAKPIGDILRNLNPVIKP